MNAFLRFTGPYPDTGIQQDIRQPLLNGFAKPAFIIISLLIAFSSNLYSQCVERYTCHSSAVKIQRVYLADANGNALPSITCTPGSLVTGTYLWMDLSTTTSRVGVWISGNIEVAGHAPVAFGQCIDIALSNSSNTPIKIGPVSWYCGRFTKLTNVFVTWNTGNTSQCSLPNPSCAPNKAQCWQQLPTDILVVETPGLSIGYQYTQGSCTGSDRTINFTAEVSGGTQPYSYAWDFDGNLSTVESTNATPSYTFASGGTYPVTLTVTDNTSGTALTQAFSQDVIVNACSCTAPSITSNPGSQSVYYGNSATFTASGTGTGLQWQVYDGVNGWQNISSPTVSFATLDMSGYKYRAIATSSCGNSAPSTEATLTVNPRPITVTADNQNKTYGVEKDLGSTAFSITSGSFVTGESIASVTLTSTGAAATAPVSGSPYSIVPSDAVAGANTDLSNYAITYSNGTLTISQKALTITANDVNKTYGDAVSFTGASSEFTVDGLTNSDAVTGATLTSDGAAASATYTSPGPTYSITIGSATGSGLSNYNITYIPGTLTIGQRTLNITANNRNKTYGDAVTFAGTEFATGTDELVNGDVISSVTLTSDGAAASATYISPGPTYPITPSAAQGSAAGNYAISYHDGTLTIGQKTASVTPNANSKTYGSADPTPITTGTLSGFISTDNVTATYSRTPGETVAGGPYTINATLSPSGVLGNYNITYNTANFTINKKAASVTPNANSKTYGSADPDPLTTGTLSGFLTADGVTASYSRTPGETVAGGPYTISATLSPSTVLGNYDITYNTANFTINKKGLTITADNKSKTYDGKTFTDGGGTFTVSYDGFVNSEDKNALGGTLGFSGDATTAVNAGTYTNKIIPGGLTSSNYNISFVNGTLTINQKAASVTPVANTKVYASTDPNPITTGTLSGFISTDNVTATYSRTTGETVVGSPYTISATLSPSSVLGNYNITYNTANFTITPAPLCLTYDGLTFGVTNTSKQYLDNGGKIKLILTVVGTPAGDLSTADVRVSITNTTVSNAKAAYVAATSTAPAYFSYEWSVPNPAWSSNTSSETYEVSWTIGGNYVISCNEDDALLTLSMPSSDFTTGGGYILNNKSKGTIGISNGETPLKNNYGFNLKWGNNLKTYQGSFNTIIRKGNREYQAKSNKPTFLSVKARTDLVYTLNGQLITPYEAVMTYENVVIKDLTGLSMNCAGGSVVPGCSQGNGIVYLRVIDMGEPNIVGSRIDSISMLIKPGWNTNSVFYSSEAYTVINNPAVIKFMNIVKGNIQVHTAGTKASARQDITDLQEISLASQLTATAAPNPYTDRIRFTLASPVSGQGSLEVFNMLGQKVATVFQGFIEAGKTQTVEYTVPDGHRTNLIYQFTVGDQRATGKLLH